MENEEWKDVIDYLDLYQVSNLGRIKSMKTGRILKNIRNIEGYLTINLFKDGEGTNLRVHRLVAQAFIPNPENKPEVNHIDENKTNNRVDNLEWVTRGENNTHGTITERTCKKTRAIDIFNGEYVDYPSQIECSRQLKIPQSSVNACVNGKRLLVGNYMIKNI